jgi:predicted protein tyrosine phosphatase
LSVGRIFVGPIWAIDKAHEIGARHAVTLINPLEMMAVTTPAHIAAENHLRLEMNDIAVATEGRILPAAHHIRALLEFLPRWTGDAPLLIHCRAGLSRSPAAAFIALCALNPGVEERQLAQRLHNACELANPNPLIVELGDTLLKRNGQMIAALECFAGAGQHEEGVLFSVAADA